MPQARADQALETETARLLEPGHLQLGTALEFQTSPNGEEYAIPMAIEFGLLKNLELMIEPVAFTSIQPRSGRAANGAGDLESSLAYLVFDERRILPAMALAGEVKFPTAQNLQIGSGEFDYRLYLIASKRIGPVDLHFNVGYNIIGQPPGVHTQNPIDLELAGEWFVNEKFDLFAEVTYTGSSGSSFDAGEGTDPGGGGVTSEISGKEIVGSVGVRAHLTRRLDLFGSFSYDNNNAKLIRTGITLKF